MPLTFLYRERQPIWRAMQGTNEAILRFLRSRKEMIPGSLGASAAGRCCPGQGCRGPSYLIGRRRVAGGRRSG